MALVKTAELANAAGVTNARISQWRAEGMPGFIKRNQWDSELALAWIAERRQDTIDGVGGTAQQRLTEMRIKLTEKQCYRADLLNARLEGSSVAASAMEQAVAKVFAKFVEAGDVWVAQGIGAVEQESRRELWFSVRNSVRGAVESVCADCAGGEDLKPARARVAEPMG